MTEPTPLDTVEFVARSPHRVEVLRRLHEGSWSRPDLHEETGISQPTLGRVLGSLEEQHWVARRGREYGLTALGELLIEEFDDLLDTVEIIQKLGDVVPLLPTDEMDFDLRRLGSATILTPQTGDVLRHVRRVQALFDGADRLILLADTIAPDSLENLHNRLVTSADQDALVESILTTAALEMAYSSPEQVEWIRDLLESGRSPVYRYDGPIPLLLALADGTAVMVTTDDHGVPAAVIESTDEVVLDWVESELDAYRQAATELTVDDLPA